MVTNALKALPTNSYGQIDVRFLDMTKYGHVTTPRASVTCRRLGIEYAKALVGFSYDKYPMLRGIVVHLDDRERLIEGINTKGPKVLGNDSATILSCIFTVNRSAKRRRDAAASCYRSRLFGLATNHKSKKESLYELKERGIAYAASQGWLKPQTKHGGLCLWQGEGYSFHSTLCPADLAESRGGEDRIFIEAQPKKAGEPRLIDAEATLEELPESNHALDRLERPYVPRGQLTEDDEWHGVWDEDDNHW